MEPDSGAEVNLINEHQFQVLLYRTNIRALTDEAQHAATLSQDKREIRNGYSQSNLWKTRNIRLSKWKDKLTTTPQLRMLKIQPDGGLTMEIFNNQPGYPMSSWQDHLVFPPATTLAHFLFGFSHVVYNSLHSCMYSDQMDPTGKSSRVKSPVNALSIADLFSLKNRSLVMTGF